MVPKRVQFPAPRFLIFRSSEVSLSVQQYVSVALAYHPFLWIVAGFVVGGPLILLISRHKQVDKWIALWFGHFGFLTRISFADSLL
jgi:apolipoprotein N-acyltransferase